MSGSYGLFTFQKLDYTRRLNDINYQLSNIQEQRMDVTNALMTIQLIKSNNGSKASSIGCATDGAKALLAQVGTGTSDSAKEYLNALDKKLDLIQKTYETTQKKLQSDLDKVESAEEKGIEKSAPKYSGT